MIPLAWCRLWDGRLTLSGILRRMSPSCVATLASMRCSLDVQTTRCTSICSSTCLHAVVGLHTIFDSILTLCPIPSKLCAGLLSVHLHACCTYIWVSVLCFGCMHPLALGPLPLPCMPAKRLVD